MIFRKNEAYVSSDYEMDEEEQFPPTKKEITCHVFEWICGLTEFPCPVGVDCCCSQNPGVVEKDIEDVEELSQDKLDERSQAAAELAHTMSLEQKRSDKIGLYIGLLLISCLTIFFFLFFTFYFGDIVQGPVPVDVSGVISNPAVNDAVVNLQNLGIIAQL